LANDQNPPKEPLRLWKPSHSFAQQRLPLPVVLAEGKSTHGVLPPHRKKTSALPIKYARKIAIVDHDVANRQIAMGKRVWATWGEPLAELIYCLRWEVVQCDGHLAPKLFVRAQWAVRLSVVVVFTEEEYGVEGLLGDAL
jgi:hypothetical protein